MDQCVFLLVVKEADNQCLEPMFVCSESEDTGVKILSKTNSKT